MSPLEELHPSVVVGGQKQLGLGLGLGVGQLLDQLAAPLDLRQGWAVLSIPSNVLG